MVLEQLYSVQFLREHPQYGFLLGLGYTIFGIALAMLLFPNDPALIAVAITAILLLPSLYQLTSIEEQIESEGHALNFRHLWNDNKQIISVYMTIFFGSFLAFAFFALVLPKLATNFLFRQQLEVLYGVGGATFSQALFWDLLSNNFKVLLLCFLISLIAGNGSIFLIIWNASVWGTIFGNLAKTAAFNIAGSVFFLFLLIMIAVLPHVFLEMLSYILSVISGTVISDGFAKESILSPRMKSVLVFNLAVLGSAILVLILGAIVETFVLNNFQTYATIASLAFR